MYLISANYSNMEWLASTSMCSLFYKRKDGDIVSIMLSSLQYSQIIIVINSGLAASVSMINPSILAMDILSIDIAPDAINLGSYTDAKRLTWLVGWK